MVVRELTNLIGFKVDNKQLQNSEQKFKNIKRNILSIGAAALSIITPIAIFAKRSLTLYDQQAEAISNVEATLKSTGEMAGRTLSQLEEQATSLQKNTFFGDEAILKNVTAQMLTFTNITTNQFDRAQQAVLDVTAKLYGLNASEESLRGTTLQLSKALNDPVSNLGALSRSGIQFSKDQKDLIKSLWETGKQAEAHNLILKELEKQYGGTAEALARTGKGMEIQIRNQIGDIMELVGKEINPMRLELLKLLKDLLTSGLVQSILNVVKALYPLMSSLLKLLIPISKVLEIISKVLGSMAEIISNIISNSLIPVINNLLEIITPMLEQLGEILIEIMIALEPVLGIIFHMLSMTVKKLLMPLRIMLLFLKPYIKLLSFILTPFLIALEKIFTIMDALQGVAQNLFIEIIGKAIDWIVEKLGGLGDALKGMFSGIFDFFTGIINGVIDGINWLITKTNQIAKTKIELIDRLDTDKLITKDITNNNQKNQNINIQNAITVNGMKDKQQVKQTIEKTAGSVFNLELKKLLIEAGGL